MWGTKDLMATSRHYVMLEHKFIGASFFTDGIILEPIYNPIVGNTKPVLVVTLEPNGLFKYVYVFTSILEPIEVVSDMIQNL